MAVSQGTIDGIVERIPAAARLPHGVIPLGFEPADFAALRARPEGARLFDAADGFVHLCYVGTLLPTGAGTLRLLLRGLARARRDDPAALRLRLHFFGTSNQSDSNVHRVLPIAHECGVADVVTEMPGRLDYLDALPVLMDASAILLLGSSERHYTASKLFPALLAKRPILALFHEASSVVSILRAAGSEPSVRIVTYGDGEAGDDRVGEVACHLRALAALSGIRRGRRIARSHCGHVGASARTSTGRGLQSGRGMTTPVRLTAVLTHPIQYYAPWFRRIHASAPELALTVVHATQPTPEQQGVGFDRAFEWDIPLTEGYRSIVVRPPHEKDRIDSGSFTGLDVPEIGRAIADTSPDVVLITGWYSVTLVRALLACRRLGVPTLYRGDSHLLSGPRGWKRPLWTLKTHLLLRQFDGFLSPGVRVREYLRWYGVPDHRIFQVPHAVDNEMFAATAAPYQNPDVRAAARRRWGIEPDAFVVLFVGKLVASEASAERRTGGGAPGARARR